MKRTRCLLPFCLIGISVLTLCQVGCGTTREYQATEQLLLSDAVDRSVSTIDFRPLSGEKVYLDTAYLRSVKSDSFVNADYVTSALRQQIMAAGCLMQELSKDADIIIEPRIGTLGADDHRVTFGVPENNAIGSAATLLSSAPAIPNVPEIAFARRDAREGAAKIAAFAYDRETRLAVWQSGVSQSRSTARDTWVMGVGPFQAGSIRDATRLAGTKYLKFGQHHTGSPPKTFDRPQVDYTAETRFDSGWPILNPNEPSINDSLLPESGLLPGDRVPTMIATQPEATAGKEESGTIVR
ncbi:hypothetical protein SAMN06265222_11765 [Neorhodopirellula lusitana]|uniref:DUF3313 domain-containing protein n=1 Tax=Neorhodopirellula lusitana TaxID=445327 RepID=A0ABY1QKJ0_9BACT|nr:DUF6655 family protein [Neorhodopirellula lusitana]SMP74134.1 hypothetical protein SAMN06265222_11765 [Neorhodopirellula lusitana]